MVQQQKQDRLKMNGYTFRGSNSFIFIFASHLSIGKFLKKEFAPKEQILSLVSTLYFESAALSRKENRKSQ